MWKSALLIFLTLSIGVIGYHIIEGWSALDSLYMTVITIFTVGYGEVRELSPQGQVFTIFIILSGVGTVAYTAAKIGDIIVEGKARHFWRRRKMNKRLNDLRNHYIICGHGRIGKIVRERLEEEKLPYVVIDLNEEKLKCIRQNKKCLFIHGDATHEDVLIKAGIKKARALASLLPNDADNLYVVLTVKQIQPSLFVLSKALDEEGEKKIIQIGANKIVSPYKLSGLKISQALIRPTVVEFMDFIIRREEISLFIEEFTVKKDAAIIGKNLRENNIRKTSNVIVVATKKPGEEVIFNPSPEKTVEPGDTLLVLGAKDDISKFEEKFLEAGY